MSQKQLLVLTAGLGLAALLTAGTITTMSANSLANSQAKLSTTRSTLSLMARGEPQPGDDKGKDGSGHKFTTLMARGEPQPGDQRREPEPGDDRGKDGRGHKVANLMARGEPQPGDDKGKDGSGHKFAVERPA